MTYSLDTHVHPGDGFSGNRVHHLHRSRRDDANKQQRIGDSDQEAENQQGHSYPLTPDPLFLGWEILRSTRHEVSTYRPQGTVKITAGRASAVTVAKSPFHSSTRSTPRGPEEMLLERTTLAIIAGVSRHLRQMIQLMPQLSFLSSVEDSCSGSKSSSATACDASPCAPLYTIAELV